MRLTARQFEADQALLQLGQRLRADGYRFTSVTPATHTRVNAREFRAGQQPARRVRLESALRPGPAVNG